MKKNTFRKVILCLISFIVLYVAVLQCKIYQYSHQEIPKNADFLIILGARVKGDIPSLSLLYRIEAAADYLHHNQNTIAIASGGQGKGETISEALCIKNELVKRGIEESRIIEEDQSTSTLENLLFSKKYVTDDDKVGLLVTNDFHVYRAKKIAKKLNWNLGGIPAKTPLSAKLKSYTREYIAITKYKLSGDI